MNKLAVLEGLLFVVGEDGLTINQMMEILDVTLEDAKELISRLKEKYEAMCLDSLLADHMKESFSCLIDERCAILN